MFLKKFSIFLVLVIFFASFTFGEDSGFGINFNLGLGVESFDSVDENNQPIKDTFQKISLSPDISFGKFGIGLDIAIHYKFAEGDFVIRTQDWVPDVVDFSNILSLYLGKFRYARFGLKGEPLFVKFGSIDDGTLGNGFIVSSYSNTLFLPDQRILGLNFDLDGALFNFPLIGVETIVGNISNFDVLGAHLFIRPLSFLEIPILSDLKVGTTIAADIKPFASNVVSQDQRDEAIAMGITEPNKTSVIFTGVDFKLPILSNPILSTSAFGDFATYNGDVPAVGGMIGFGGALFSIFGYGAQLRFIGENFIPSYFNQSYDLNRASYYMMLNGTEKTPGYIGWLASLGTSLIGNMITLQFVMDGPFSTLPGDISENPAAYPHLAGSLALKEGLIPGISFDASYDKILIKNFEDLITPEGAIIKAKLNYTTGGAVISLVYQIRYKNGDWTKPDITSGLESLIKL